MDSRQRPRSEPPRYSNYGRDAGQGHFTHHAEPYAPDPEADSRYVTFTNPFGDPWGGWYSVRTEPVNGRFGGGLDQICGIYGYDVKR
jgi:hypothetical protein